MTDPDLELGSLFLWFPVPTALAVQKWFLLGHMDLMSHQGKGVLAGLQSWTSI